MHLHVLGIGGTFMAGLALLARALGHRVTGSDAGVYPPMSEQLQAEGIAYDEGWRPEVLEPPPDVVVVGNALSRGNPLVEEVLDRGLPYTSGPQWLAEEVLRRRQVVAVAGTHGKTTTSSMLAWVLDQAGLSPGFLIGGIPAGFGVSARLGDGPLFVVEADEYDTAFFDKRSKFVHYRPRTVVLNNLEYDHADIFPDLAAIQRQFHHLVRTVPRGGRIVRPADDAALDQVLAMGCWTPVETTGAGGAWGARLLAGDGSRFDVVRGGEVVGTVGWGLIGAHNVANALAAVAAAGAVGVAPAVACPALSTFRGVRRRLELQGVVRGVSVYDDFAHHPTAVHTTLAGLRRHVGAARVVAVMEPRSNTMRLGVHRDQLAAALDPADLAVVYAPPGLGWDVGDALAPLGERVRVLDSLEAVVELVTRRVGPGDHVVLMSNGSFGGLHERLLANLAGAPPAVVAGGPG